jgi:radical SAM superfamily enzyme YgiQ (UPF0313 family)
MTMKFALVAPPWEVMMNSYPPLGLGYVAAATIDAGFPTSIHDFGLEPHTSVSHIVDAVLATDPQVIGITTWTHLYHVCCELAQAFKRRRPDIPIVLGGPHVTIFPTETLEEEADADFVIYGEGELAMADLLKALQTKGSYSAIEGLAWRDGSKIVKNAPRPINRAISDLPFPARDVMQIDKYPLRAWNGERMTTMMTSRGCPCACTYCVEGLFGRRGGSTPGGLGGAGWGEGGGGGGGGGGVGAGGGGGGGGGERNKYDYKKNSIIKKKKKIK